MPENYPLGEQTVKVSYTGDWKMGGMTSVDRTGGIEWHINVVGAQGGVPITTPGGLNPIWLIVLATAIAVLLVATRSKWVPKLRSRMQNKNN